MNQRCIQCGAEIMPGFQFCMNCGAAVYPIAPEPVQEQSESSVVPNQAHEAMPPVAAPAPIEMSQYPPVPNQFVPVMDPNQPVMNQYPMQGTMPTKTKKPKNPEVMTRAANAGLAVVLSLSLLFTTLTVFVSFRKDISSNSFMARVVEVVDDGIVWVILSAVLLVGFLALCTWMNVKRKKEIVLVVSIACLCAGSLFLQLQGINAMIVAVSEMIMGAILLLVYSFLSREKKMTDNEDIKETAVA
ncbi:MAG: zinc ribbon domain-containing protein [Clostridiales bacterium]|nr:zinc ribbon domain-containing protein [Clostridiales bacterium]